MKTLISGQSGLAIFVQGNEAVVTSIGDKEEKKVSLNALNGLLADATDVITRESISKSNAIKLLEYCWRCDRSLHLIIILLDSDELDDLSLSAAECLEELFQDKEILTYVSRILYSAPLPLSANIEKALRLSQNNPKLKTLLEELKTDQVTIKKYAAAWNALPIDYFGSIDSKNEFRQELIKKGAFASFVKAHNDYSKFTTEQINYLMALKDLKNFRQILAIWLRDLKPKKDREVEIVKTEQSFSYEEKNRESKKQKQYKVYDVFQNIEKQKKGIVESIKKENVELARRYVEQLINMQRKTGPPEYIAKSLCDLAQESKEVYNYSFQLELAQRAVDIAPEDGWAHGQLADALFCLNKFNDALQSYQNAAFYGQEAFGLNGRAKIILEQGRFEEAFEAYTILREKFPEEVMIWAGFAEVLRRMWWLDEALNAYNEAIKEFPLERYLKCGRAATLTDMGNLEEAIRAYDDCIDALGEDEVSINGKGTVLRKMGRYNEALKWYDWGLRRVPDNIALLYGRAKVFNDGGQFPQALKELDAICTAYPYEVRGWIGKAEVFKELREFNEAIQVYDQALERFPFNRWVCNGRASVYKKQGAYEKALQTYETNLFHAPYDLIAKCGKADLLKELGKFEDALATYDEIIKKNPYRKNLQHAKASIYIALGNYQKAEELLSYLKTPSTRDDWIAYHVKGVLCLKTNKIDDAISIFENALKTSPFVNDHKYFRNSLAVAKLKRKDFNGTVKLLSKEVMPTSNILRLHAWGEIAKNNKEKIKEAKIARECLEVDCPPYLIPLMVELELRYFNDIPKGEHSEDWIFEQECISGALSSV